MNKRLFWVAATAVFPLLSLCIGLLHTLHAAAPVGVVIDAVLYDGQLSGDSDEAVRLRNVSDIPKVLDGWQLSDGEATAVLPAAVTLNAGEAIWLARYGDAFQQSFGFAPDFELHDTSITIPNLSGGWTGFGNNGDQIMLRDDSGVLVDCLVYEGNYSGECGSEWNGAALQPYTVSNLFGDEGQLLYRKRDQATGWPVADTQTIADWAQDPDDVINGRKLQYPGWQLDAFFQTVQVTETAVLTVAIAPDNAYLAIINQINSAQTSIRAESLTFENLGIAQALIDAASRGVIVTILLEGSPPGGLPDQEKYICQQLDLAGAQCWFMIRDDSADIADRYRYLHAKFMLIDNTRVIISSENLSPNSLPYDTKADGTWGRRGVVVITDAPGVITHLNTLFAADFDVANHADLFRWHAAHENYGAPPAEFLPVTETGGVTYTVRYPYPVGFYGTFGFELVQAPENSLRDLDGLLGLLNHAKAGDTLLIQQLVERPYWGVSTSNAVDDPNPRLEAAIAAARRGAAVQMLLDELFDVKSATSNRATCIYVNAIARAESLNMQCATANPTGLGIHNKMVLAEINGRGTVHIGSINGTEQSNKGNRELAVQVQSDEAYAYLAAMFAQDWPKRIYMPLLLNDLMGPAPYPLISEVLYDPYGLDDAEFIELVNPTTHTIDISGYAIGDAVNPTDFEDVKRFPPGTTLLPGSTIVVATTATAFFVAHGFNPDFEIVGTDTAVPDLIDDPAWGDPAALLQLANNGDEIILRNAADKVIDVVTYGSGSYPNVAACNLVTASNRSLERYPYWVDTNDCSSDFREWPFPNPGDLP
jgi:cardiolipin synthase A/B